MKWRILLIVTAILLGVWIRLSVTHKESPDSVYHLRRAKFAVQYFPRTILFDRSMNFPDGGFCIWPPLFDLSLAIPTLLTGKELERMASFVPVLFAAGAIAAAGFAGMAVRKGAGIATAFFVAACPGHLQYSQFGHTDQHVAESFFGFSALAFFLWSSRKPSRILECGAGLSLALAVLTWQGAIFWAPLFGIALILEILFSKKGIQNGRLIRILGIPAAIVTVATWYWLDGWKPPFTYVSFGWFQPVFLSTTFSFVSLFQIIRKRSLIVAGLFVFSIIPVILNAGSFFNMVTSGVLHLASTGEGSDVVQGGLLSYSGQWLSQIVEYRPLLADQWDWALGYLSFAFFLFPLPLLIWVGRLKRRVNPAFHGALIACGCFIFMITLMQRRNVYYGSLVGALSALELSSYTSIRLSRRLLVRGDQKPRIVFAAIFLTLSLPMLLALPSEMRNDYSAGEARLETLRQLKKLMPQEVDLYDTRLLNPHAEMPEWKTASSVLPFWSQGHLVTYFSERPVAANNFGYGFQDSLRFFLAETEEEALAIASRHRSKFVLSLDIATVINRYGEAAGKPRYILWNGKEWKPEKAYYRTLQVRMHDYDGKGAILPDGSRVEPLQHFRLRYASTAGIQRLGRFVPQFKIFEVVN